MSIDLTKYDTRTDLILEEIKASDGIVTDILNPFPHTKITKVSILNDMYNKKKGEYYPDYIERIINSDNKLALEVKLADLTHNIDINRIKDPSVNDYERVTKRYIPAYNKILNKLDSMKKEK